MTEEEAKTKWCPFVRAWEGAGQSWVNRPLMDENDHGHMGPTKVFCIGAACMAWRWSEEKRTSAFLEAVQAKMQAQTKPNFATATQAVYAETGGKFARVEGGCGLAGTPQ